MKGFMLINAMEKTKEETFSRLMQVPEIVEVQPIQGECDMVVKTEGKNPFKLRRTIKKILEIDGVTTVENLNGWNRSRIGGEEEKQTIDSKKKFVFRKICEMGASDPTFKDRVLDDLADIFLDEQI